MKTQDAVSADEYVTLAELLRELAVDYAEYGRLKEAEVCLSVASDYEANAIWLSM